MRTSARPKLSAILLCVFIAVGLPLAAEDTTVAVAGAVEHPLTLKATDLADMPRARVQSSIHGAAATYEGVWLSEILQRAGAPLGSALRGKALATYVRVDARDGYQVVFSLAELDPSFADHQILLADRVNGKELPAEEGPLRLVAPQEKPGARSVRMVSKIEVVRLRP